MTRRANYMDVIRNLTGGGSILLRDTCICQVILKYTYELINGAQGRNRTGTPVKARDFKSLASTNFATWAYKLDGLTIPLISLKVEVALCTTVYHNATWAYKLDGLTIPLISLKVEVALCTTVYHNATWAY